MTPRTSGALHLKCALSAASWSQLLCFNIFGVPPTLLSISSASVCPGSSDWLRPFCAIAWQFAVLPVAAVPPDQKRMWHLCGGNGICMQLNLWLWRGVYLYPAFASSGGGAVKRDDETFPAGLSPLLLPQSLCQVVFLALLRCLSLHLAITKSIIGIKNPL